MEKIKIKNYLTGFIPFTKGDLASNTHTRPEKSIFTGMSGMYVLIHLKSQRVYVGSSGNIAARCSSHLTALKNNIHKNQRLQDLYNEDNGIIFYIKEVKKSTEIEEEQRLVNLLSKTGLLCNYGIIDVSRAGLGVKRSRDTIDKITSKHRGVKRTDETKEKMRISHLGIPLSENTKKKLSDIGKARLNTPEGKKSHAKGIAKLSHVVIVDGIEYPSKSEVSRKFNLALNAVIYRIASKNFPSWILKRK